jgi:hypothetical protein
LNRNQQLILARPSSQNRKTDHVFSEYPTE